MSSAPGVDVQVSEVRTNSQGPQQASPSDASDGGLSASLANAFRLLEPPSTFGSRYGSKTLPEPLNKRPTNMVSPRQRSKPSGGKCCFLGMHGLNKRLFALATKR